MALITATRSLDLSQLNLFDLAASSSSVLFANNINVRSDSGFVYEDRIQMTAPVGRGSFYGAGFEISVSGVVIGGTVQAFIAESTLEPGSYTDWFAIEGISVAAGTLYDTSATSTNADELALIEQQLAGADVFDLSEEDDKVWGGGGADTMRGNGGDDSLRGDAGNDSLDGGTGADTLVGGTGNDSFVVDQAGDSLVEAAGEGTDTVRSTINWTLGANFENLQLLGADALAGTGNALANRIIGNSGANRLDGGAANDTINAAEGSDTLVGGTGADWLDGGAGSDSLTGGSGNDVYIVDSALDRVVEALGADSDTVRSSVSLQLAANLETLVLTGSGTIAGYGNSLANTITGNGAANILSGGVGNDTLNGGAGNDLLNGGSGNDLLAGGSGQDRFHFSTALNGTSNRDTISGFVSADDTIGLDDAIFTNAGALGALTVAAFRIGTAAGDATDRIIYNPATGLISYDADGSGSVAAIVFAAVAPNTSVVAADFLVF